MMNIKGTGMKLMGIIICFGFIQTNQAQTFTSSNLPIIIINTNGLAIADEPKITADMGIIYNGAGIRNNLHDFTVVERRNGLLDGRCPVGPLEPIRRPSFLEEGLKR